MRILKSTIIILITLGIGALIILGGWAIWEHNRDPISAIDFDAGQINVAQDSVITTDLNSESRTYRHIILATEHLGEIEAYISQPINVPLDGLPVIILLGGLEIGINNFQLIQNQGNNIFIIYKYPYSPHYWYTNTLVTQIPGIRRAVLSVPSQVLTLNKWVSQQPWAENERVCILGYSFGAIFLPAIYHLAHEKNEPLIQGIIVYGGADIYDILKTNLRKISQPFRSTIAWLTATAIYPLEPALHLSDMNNEFLIINGTKDNQISEYSWRKLHELVPEPKTIIILDEGHMHPKKPELTKKLVNISKNWLVKKGVINP